MAVRDNVCKTQAKIMCKTQTFRPNARPNAGLMTWHGRPIKRSIIIQMESQGFIFHVNRHDVFTNLLCSIIDVFVYFLYSFVFNWNLADCWTQIVTPAVYLALYYQAPLLYLFQVVLSKILSKQWETEDIRSQTLYNSTIPLGSGEYPNKYATHNTYTLILKYSW